jgi:hypothetical protein
LDGLSGISRNVVANGSFSETSIRAAYVSDLVFYANCHKSTLSICFKAKEAIHGKFSLSFGSLRNNGARSATVGKKLKLRINLCTMGSNPCWGYGSRLGFIRIFLVLTIYTSKSFGSSQCDLSSSQSLNPSYRKSAGSENPDFTSKEAPYIGPKL